LDNIRVIKTGLRVNKILSQLKEFPEDWESQQKIENADSMLNYGFREIEAGVLQLIMGVVTSVDQYVGDSEFCKPTPAYYHHTEVIRFMKRHFHDHSRCGFLSLPVKGTVGKHVDIGSYYQTRDRYHLSIQGTYEYTIGDESIIVEPGTLLWFNNKLEHGTRNIGDCVRITFVFDVPHHRSNP
jgi:mannose-6-phosphate isomerase-like protein (cupin superfamily)